ncbi:MAG: hypothetical protein KJS92_09275 [Bacteroidetes bacterium]|nr:hypothetical protein [Bacteroidota bacterium]
MSCAAKQAQTNPGNNESSGNGAVKPAIIPATKGCIDSSKINPNAICTRIYLPVCGCDSVSYANACEAEASGVTWWRPGECDSLRKKW